MVFRPLRSRLRLSGVLIGIVFALTAAAASEAPTLTLEQALELARASSLQIQAAQRELDAATARRQQTDGFEPLTVFHEWEESPTLNPSRAGDRRLGVEQDIDWPGKRTRRKQAADLDIAANEALLERAQLRTAAQVRKSFDQTLAGGEIVRLLTTAVERLREAVALSRVRFQSGAGQYLDVLRTQVALQRAQNELREAELAQRESARRLNILLGRSGTPVQPVGLLTAPELPPPRAEASANGPTFALAERRSAQAQRQAQAARAGRYPDFRLSLARQRLTGIDSSEDAWAGGIGLRLPLPGSDRQRGLEAEALASARAIQDRNRALTLTAQARLQQRYDEAAALAAQMRTYREAILPDVDDQLKAAQQEYRVRRIDALNLLDVYNTYLSTQRGYIEALARYRSTLIDIETQGEDLWEITE